MGNHRFQSDSPFHVILHLEGYHNPFRQNHGSSRLHLKIDFPIQCLHIISTSHAISTNSQVSKKSDCQALWVFTQIQQDTPKKNRENPHLQRCRQRRLRRCRGGRRGLWPLHWVQPAPLLCAILVALLPRQDVRP